MWIRPTSLMSAMSMDKITVCPQKRPWMFEGLSHVEFEAEVFDAGYKAACYNFLKFPINKK
ncbi:hypothetical protein CRE_25835 [Caenorhabditis remanei]|uniref:Uncharacterized protein n=1 Tax=Caenorhabditis remanei TaxID=31234 RepID=E3NA87_CAERE|nr:hypothetical protein CRE_25835 [Caenorhabditis remanei]